MRASLALRAFVAAAGAAGRRRRLALPSLLAVAGAAGCQLRGVTLAEPADVVVAEVVLQAGASTQFAWLHRTLGNDSLAVPGATVAVTEAGGAVVAFRAASGRVCVDSSAAFAPDTSGSCYTAALPVVAGAAYSLKVVTADGRVLTGTTTVPGAFQLTRPAPGGRSGGGCYLPPGTLLPLAWTRSSGAWVYVSDTRLTHIRRALDPNAPNDRSMDLQGFSVSASDTTIVFPSEFGIFDRADSADAPILLALQKGLPAGVSATVVVAAADRNYVNWVRRGSFNPSGVVQIPSIRGDGTGVFGSMVPVRFDLTSSPGSTLPRCTG